MRTPVGMSLCLSTLMLWAGTAQTFAEGDRVPPAIIQKYEKHIDFRVGKALVARYHVAPSVAKPYFWPVNAPNGTPITRAWPMATAEKGERKDHVHQKSAWFCHGDVIPEGLELKHKIKNVDGVDFWSENKGHGRIIVKKVGEVSQKGNHAQVTTVNEWQTADGVKILDETRTIHLYNLGDAQLLVLDIDLHASEYPITFGDTKEGSMGVRVRHLLTEVRNGTLENADGKVGAGKLWGVHSNWCDYSGPLPVKGSDKTATVGITIFDDTNNSPRSAWHSRNYGLMAANPFGRSKSRFPAVRDSKDLKKLEKGEHLKLRYGLYLHMGNAKAGQVAQAYEKFLNLKK